MFLSRIAIEALYKFAKIPKKNTVSDSEGRGADRKAQIDQTKWCGMTTYMQGCPINS